MRRTQPLARAGLTFNRDERLADSTSENSPVELPPALESVVKNAAAAAVLTARSLSAPVDGLRRGLVIDDQHDFRVQCLVLTAQLVTIARGRPACFR
jgi:hypothetical protein